jgi:hypothetical protein
VIICVLCGGENKTLIVAVHGLKLESRNLGEMKLCRKLDAFTNSAKA